MAGLVWSVVEWPRSPMRRLIDVGSLASLVELIVDISDAGVVSVPLVVERVQLPVLSLVDLSHSLVQEIPSLEVILHSGRSSRMTSSS